MINNEKNYWQKPYPHNLHDEEFLTENGKIDYHKLKPVLFEMPTYEYLRTGEVIGKCMSFGNEKK